MMHNSEITSGSTDTAPGALSVSGPQPAWMTLNEARERAFTGEVVFEVEPEVHAYFDNGVVYYAERATDAALGRRLVDGGVIDAAQLERGTVRVGDAEHLGRLFDRDPSIDRDAVLVMTETATGDLVAELANRAICAVRATAYRHHRSGVQRWFVTPLDSAPTVRPLGDVSQLGATVVDDLPALAMVGLDADELTIEWDEPIDDYDDFQTSTSAVDEFVIELQSEFAEMYDALPDADSIDRDVADEATDDEFSVMWPNGSEQSTRSDGTDGDGADPASRMLDAPVGLPIHMSMQTPIRVNGQRELRFEMPALALSDEIDTDDIAVPDDVADAVRRAIAAVELATSEVPVIPSISTAAAPTMPAAAAFAGFAPPTMAMRAEVLYGQIEAEDAAGDAVEAFHTQIAPAVQTDGSALMFAPSLGMTSGMPSMAFVDDDGRGGSGDDPNGRSSALRRLIGGLRRKDR